MTKTVFLDIDNTLLDFNESARLSMMEAFNEAGLAFSDAMFSTFLSVNDALWMEIEKEQLTREELHQIRWAKIFEKLGVDFDGPTFEAMFLRRLATSHSMVPGAMELLAYLHPKYTVCLASNASVAQQTKRLESSGLLPYVHKVFLSGALGIPKPEKGFWDSCFSQLPGALPAESIIIGDSLSADIKGGITYGMKTCWFNPDALPVPDGVMIDYVVTSLSEIQEIL